MPTPLIQNSKLYVLENSGILSCYALESGKQVFKQRVRSDIANVYTASPVALDGKLYLVSEAGLTFVVSMDEEGTVVSKGTLRRGVRWSELTMILGGRHNNFWRTAHGMCLQR